MKKIMTIIATVMITSPAFSQEIYQQYGNTIYGPGGPYTTYGNNTYSPGGVYSTFGNTTYGPNGATAQTFGNNTFINGPGGSSAVCTRVGNAVYCN
jgi:hypothetical protein